MNTPINEVRTLCDALLENRITAADLQRLESFLLADSTLRQFYINYMNLHAGLHWLAADPPSVRPAIGIPKPADYRLRFLRWVGIAVVVCVVWVFWRPTHAAVLVEAHRCKWEGGDLPTAPGSKLYSGRLHLAEGVARLHFRSGAEVRLEGPADLQLIDARRVILHSGRLITRMVDGRSGFVVETPNAVLTDLGTEFGVTVGNRGTVEVQVFEGMVDAQPKNSTEVHRLHTGQGLRVSATGIDLLSLPTDENPKEVPTTSVPLKPGVEILRISTAFGRGKEAMVQSITPQPKRLPGQLLMIKNSFEEKTQYHRKAYLAFDLSETVCSDIVEAELILHFAPTGLGFASRVPDATFHVYGLIDPILQDWPAEGWTWESAPANCPGGAAVDPKRTVLLGSFTLAQGVLAGVRGIDGAALVEFLRRERSGLVTLIIVRETRGQGPADMPHGFAGKDHPTLPPPTLRLTVRKR